jgi:hypothetical protein
MLEMQEISLKPSWYGKIDWSNGCTINPKMIEYYKSFDCVNNTYLWGDFVSPIYDENLEYIKNFKSSNTILPTTFVFGNSNDNVRVDNIMVDKDSFTSSRNTRDRKPRDRQNKTNRNNRNNTSGKRYYRFEDVSNDSNNGGNIDRYDNNENIFQNRRQNKYIENKYILEDEENKDDGNENETEVYQNDEIISDPENYEEENQ